MLALLTVLLVVLVVDAIAGLALHDMLLRRVRGRHPDLWQSLGPPNMLFDDGGLAGFSAVRGLCREPDLRNRCCSEIIAVISRTRAYGRGYMLLAVITFAVLMACVGRLL